jgi:hypothetical protein
MRRDRLARSDHGSDRPDRLARAKNRSVTLTMIGAMKTFTANRTHSIQCWSPIDKFKITLPIEVRLAIFRDQRRKPAKASNFKFKKKVARCDRSI